MSIFFQKKTAILKKCFFKIFENSNFKDNWVYFSLKIIEPYSENLLKKSVR